MYAVAAHAQLRSMRYSTTSAQLLHVMHRVGLANYVKLIARFKAVIASTNSSKHRMHAARNNGLPWLNGSAGQCQCQFIKFD